MTLPSPIPEPMVELIAARFRLLGEPMRIRALDALRDAGEASVGELAEQLGTSQQNVSRHLGVLYEAGVLGRRKEGTRVVYSIADQSMLAVCEHICDSVERRVGELSALLPG